MRIKLPLLIFSVFMFSVPLLCTESVTASETGVFNFRAVFPVVTTDFDGLDARDSQNNPVTKDSARKELEAIFCFGMYNILLTPNLHSIARSLEILTVRLNLSAFAFTRGIRFSLTAMLAAILPSTKKLLEKILILLSALAFLKMQVFAFSMCACCFMSASKEASPLPLRC